MAGNAVESPKSASNIFLPFVDVEPAKLDAIMEIKQKFSADAREGKVDLSIGVYQNAEGKTLNLKVVDQAQQFLSQTGMGVGYLPVDGLLEYRKKVQVLLFGEKSSALADKRIATVQSLGGTGALRYGADFLKRFYPDSTVYISSPSWANHRAIFERAGFKVEAYPYHDAETGGVNFDQMYETLGSVPDKSIILLHACCHNPTGVDLDPEQWSALIELFSRSKLIPFLDFAYQGFAEGIDQDAAAVRKLADSGVSFLVANSFSKNFSLYCRRTGALSIVCSSEKQAANVLTQVKTDIRTNNSNCPIDGAALVNHVLSDAGLRAEWEAEVAEMRERIKAMRHRFVSLLDQRGCGERFQRILRQNGMFSFSGLTKDEVQRLQDEFAIYIVSSGRICIAAMTESNLEYIADCVAKVV